MKRAASGPQAVEIRVPGCPMQHDLQTGAKYSHKPTRRVFFLNVEHVGFCLCSAGISWKRVLAH